MPAISVQSPGDRIRGFASENPALLFVLLYFAFQIFFLTTISNGAGVDDAEQLAYVGALQWGYGGSQPPLYTWINSIAGSVLGISLFTIYLVKFGMLASLFASVYFGARLLGLSRTVAAAGMVGIFMLPQIAWESQRTLTHSVGATTGCAWAFLAFAWHMKSRSWLSAMLLGLGFACALLGKFNASFFLLALILAGISIPVYRSVLLSRTSILAALAFAAAIAPTGLWALAHTENLLARTHKFEMNSGGQFFISRLHGEWKLFLNSVLFAGVALAFSAIAWWRSRADQAPEKRVWADAERLIARILIFALAGVFVGVLISGAAEVKDRWLQPILFLSPLFLAIVLERSTASHLPLKRFAVVGAICALIVIPGLAINMLYARDGKAPSIGQLDYARLFAVTRAEGAFGTVVSDGPQLPGNLRLFDNSITPVHAEMPNAASRIHLPALFVWFGEGMNPTVLGLMNGAGIVMPPANIKSIELTYKYYPDRSEKVSYVILPAR
ncbi:glycosyl transferase [Phyllobacterium brassicacearum]|uniref:Glycosyl transferase n=1 Tax=Phyllobacterium brassicacearum TaxID=314235 RepID=A0A2P7BPV5_9HYPH|nr:glycosyltransferase family 39 protein [Phyllobacterium brassicacearum]PSH68511.1 glycosyl transferase [Phyllobacterium brassicacearum]TDQ19844.1 4-amino-4-deoxy-L-arabinose transferase-like glycosyltransferase [Phyllobacterium brassicacearum]